MEPNRDLNQSGVADSGPPFVFGFGFKDDEIVEMRWEDVVSARSDFSWIWLHLNMNSEETRSWIKREAGLPAEAASALLAGETRPRMTSFDGGVFVNLRGVNLNEGADPEDMVSMRLWCDGARVISTRRRRLRAAQDVRAEILAGLKISTPGTLVAKLAVQLTDRMEPHVHEIEDEVDALEEEILTSRGDGCRPKLADTRQSAVLFRRFIAPQRDAVLRLASDESGLFDQSARITLREVADRVTRMTEDIDAARERAMVLQDQLADQRAEEMNRNMMLLSVVAAIFLPLGFLTGLFGINVGGMPGVDNAAAFWLVVVACIVIAFALLAIFRKAKWL